MTLQNNYCQRELSLLLDKANTHQRLSGLRVVITRPRQQADGLEALVRAEGGFGVTQPLIEIQPVALDDQSLQLLQRVQHYDGWLVTSANGVRAFAEQCAALGISGAALPQGYAVGKSTLLAAQQVGLPVMVPQGIRTSTDLGVKLAETFRGEPRRILSIEGNLAASTARSILQREGHHVDSCVLYRTQPVQSRPEVWLEWVVGSAAKNTAITLYSPSAAAVFAQTCGDWFLHSSPLCGIACIGPTTESWCLAHGIPVDIVADESSDESMCQAVAAWWQRRTAVQSTE